MRIFNIEAGAPKWKKMSQKGTILIGQTKTMLTQGPATSPVAKPVPTQIAGRLIYHGRNFIPIIGREKAEQELECDFTWLTQHTRKLLDDITDVNKAQKPLIIIWNEHVVKYDGLGRVNLEGLLLDFVDSHFHLISDLHLYCNFVCHMTAMQQAGLVTLETVIHMQRLMNNRSLRMPYSDSVTDLAALFPSLELAPTSVLHSGVHTEKVMEVMMHVHELETDKMSKSQRQEVKPTDRLSLEHGSMIGSIT